MTQIIDGFTMEPDGDGVPQFYRDANRHLIHHKGPLNMVVDLGAHIGSFSLLAARMGARLVLAYEPHPLCYIALVSNIIRNDYWGVIVPVPLAVVAVGSGGQRNFNIPERNGNSGASSLIGPGDQQITVWTQEFQSVIESAGLVDYLKVDIEGAEYEILTRDDSISELLRRVRFVDLEIHNIGPSCDLTSITSYSHNGEIYQELMDFMRKSGFRGVPHPDVMKEHGSHAFGSYNDNFLGE